MIQSHLIINSQILINTSTLRSELPQATAQVMVGRHDGKIEAWAEACLLIQADEDSYWADLSLDEDDSLAQWREGRWRVIRALFRLVGEEIPPNGKMGFYLDDLQPEIGSHINAWKPDAVDVMRQLAKRYSGVTILAPYLSAGLIWGMLKRVQLAVVQVIGPEKLEQVGLDGVDGRLLALLTGAGVRECIYVGESAVADVEHVSPPDSVIDLLNRF